MPKHAHVPFRTCLGCGARAAQSDLIRLTVDAHGTLQIQRTGGGRGGYLHRQAQCWEDFIRRKHHYRAFRIELRKDAKQKLVQQIQARERE